jgi:hypothetical protein
MTTPPSQTLVSFAILTANWEQHRISYIHNFLPLVAHCLATSDAEVVSESDVQERLAESFGLQLPRSVIKTILRRAAKEKLVTRGNRVYRPDPKALAAFDFSKKRTEASRGLEALLDRFRAFLREEFQLEPSQQEAEAVLLNYVAERSIPILRASIRGEAFEPELLTEQQYDYAVGRFISQLYERDPTNFEFLEMAVKGSILASAMYLPDVGSMGRRIRNLTVYLDTPFLIALIGYSGEPGREAANELLDLLAELGAELACYEHTITETQNVLSSGAGHLRSLSRRSSTVNIYPPLVEYCLQNGIASTDLEVRSERLVEELQAMGIAVHPTPPYTEEVSVDERVLEDVLQQVVGYRYEGARLNDLRSLTAVYRARQGIERRELETAHAIFTTPNAALVRASREFFRESPRGDRVPISSLDHELATIAWLKRPVNAPDLPRKQLIADCYASGFPSEELWSRYLDEIDRLDKEDRFSDEDYFTLRFSVEARRGLMNETLGDADVFTAGTVQQVLARAREAHQAELRQQLREVSAVSETATERLRRAELDTQRVEEERKEAERRFKEELEEIESQPERVFRLRSSRAAHRIVRIGMWSLFVILVASSAAGALLDLDSPMTVVVSVILALVAVLGIVNLFFGTTVKDWADQVQGSLADRLQRRAIARFKRELDRSE